MGVRGDPGMPEGHCTSSFILYLSYTEDRFPNTPVTRTVTLNASLNALRRIPHLP